MPWWISAIGPVIFGLATFVVAWSALKPRQRIFATRLVRRWTARAFMTVGLAYFVWMNVSFLTKEGPVGRVELWLLLVVEAEAVIVFTIILLVKVFSIYMKSASERYVKLLETLGADYKKPAPVNETTLEAPGYLSKI